MSVPVLDQDAVYDARGTGPSTMFLPAPTYVDARYLTAATAEAHTVPTGANYVVFSATADFWVLFSASAGAGTAAIPAADNSIGTAPMLNPVSHSLANVAELSVIAATTGTVVTMAFYA